MTTTELTLLRLLWSLLWMSSLLYCCNGLSSSSILLLDTTPVFSVSTSIQEDFFFTQTSSISPSVTYIGSQVFLASTTIEILPITSLSTGIFLPTTFGSVINTSPAITSILPTVTTQTSGVIFSVSTTSLSIDVTATIQSSPVIFTVPSHIIDTSAAVVTTPTTDVIATSSVMFNILSSPLIFTPPSPDISSAAIITLSTSDVEFTVPLSSAPTGVIATVISSPVIFTVPSSPIIDVNTSPAFFTAVSTTQAVFTVSPSLASDTSEVIATIQSSPAILTIPSSISVADTTSSSGVVFTIQTSSVAFTTVSSTEISMSTILTETPGIAFTISTGALTSQLITATPLQPNPSGIPILPKLVSVIMTFLISTITKRNADSFTEIELDIANAIGISAERIAILSVQQNDSVLVINATIEDLNSTEFSRLANIINNSTISINFQGKVYQSQSIALQSSAECSSYTLNYDCVSLADVMPCPTGMLCQPFTRLLSCIPCECNLVLDDATCSDGCIRNVCAAPPVTAVVSTSSVSLPPSTKPTSGGLSGGAIAGIVVGVLVAVIVAMVVGIILIYLLWSHKNKSKYVPGSRRSTYDGMSKRPIPKEWGANTYRTTTEMFTLSEQLTAHLDADDSMNRTYSMFTDL